MVKFKARLMIHLTFANNHIRSAHYFAKESYKIEKLFIEEYDEEVGVAYTAHRAYVTSSIFCSVAFLEARINELTLGAKENINPWEKCQPEAKYFDILNSNDLDERSPTLDKYQAVLSILKLTEFQRGVSPYQSVKLLIKLRDYLLHFKPEKAVYIVPENSGEEFRWLSLLKSKFTLNPIAETWNKKNEPESILGYGCAKWAVASSVKFVDEFNRRIGLNREAINNMLNSLP